MLQHSLSSKKIIVMNEWKNCRRLLCIRLDNMGDVIMASPAFRALKKDLQCHITLLTSSAGSLIAPFVSSIDDVMICDVPWVKLDNSLDPPQITDLIQKISERHFDACVIFTVYSQSSLPAATLAFMAGISLRLAYCRENPYDLLTHWVPDEEPYTFIRHQIERDLHLVSTIGINIVDNDLALTSNQESYAEADKRLSSIGFNSNEPYIILHPGVSEKKREYPSILWIETARIMSERFGFQILITGSKTERALTDIIAGGAELPNVFSAGGILSIDQFIAIVARATLVVSVNTSAAHIASAFGKPLVVLYALTNPQHTPWKGRSQTLVFSIDDAIKSRNEVVRFVSKKIDDGNHPLPTPKQILNASEKVLRTFPHRNRNVLFPVNMPESPGPENHSHL
jgi:ADP-heptose:LPS heptosyltransferase